MGFILHLPPLAPGHASLALFWRRLSTEYGTLRNNYRESLSESLIFTLCADLATATGCKKVGFVKNAAAQQTTLTFVPKDGAPTGVRFTVVVTFDGYGKTNRRPCPSCGQVYDGRDIGGLGWTNAHNVINHGKIGLAVRFALDATLKQAGVSDPRLTSVVPGQVFVVAQLVGVAEGYSGPAVTFGSGEQCAICEKIHASDSLLQRHYRCLQHKATYAYRSIKIAGTDYIRGNECIVGMQFGATRIKPEGDVARLKILTQAVAGKIAGAVVDQLGDWYGKNEARADMALVQDLLLASDALVWHLRKRLYDVSDVPPGVLPVDRNQVAILNPVVPAATAVPVVVAPVVAPQSTTPPPPVVAVVPPVLAVVAVDGGVPVAPAPPAMANVVHASGNQVLKMRLGNLKQRLQRAPYAVYGVQRMMRARGFQDAFLPDRSVVTDPNSQLVKIAESIFAARMQNRLDEPTFTALTRELFLIGFDSVRGQKVLQTKVDMGWRWR